MRFTKRAATGLFGAVLATSALTIVGASPASAVTPTGGCWVYSPTTPGRHRGHRPGQQHLHGAGAVGRPAGPAADYTLTSSGSTAVGGTRNFSLTFNVGPKNGGPPASGTVVLLLLGQRRQPAAPITKAFSAAGGAAPSRATPSPGRTRSRAPACRTSCSARSTTTSRRSCTRVGLQRPVQRHSGRPQPGHDPGRHQHHDARSPRSGPRPRSPRSATRRSPPRRARAT